MMYMYRYRRSQTRKVVGPSDYVTGGFEVVMGNLEVVTSAIVKCNGGYIAEIPNDGIDGNKVTIVVKKPVDVTGNVTATHAACSATGAAYPSAGNLLSASGSLVTEVAPEVAAGTDLSGVEFVIVAEGV